MSYQTIHTPQQWDSALSTLPYNHALQSWNWGNFKNRWGWSAERLLWFHGDTPAAAAQVLARPIPRTPWRFLYVTKGPALNYADTSLVARVLSDLEDYARQSKALFIKIDPDVPCNIGESSPPLIPPKEEEMIKSSPQWGELEGGYPGNAMLELLNRRGWQFSAEQIQFRNTVVIDLAGEPDDLLARMKSKWRYNIRLAGRKGVEIRSGDALDLPVFYQMYAETAHRDGFLIRPQAYYFDAWQRFLAAGQAEILLASVGNEVVAGLILFIFGQTAWYMYGASTGQHRNLMPNHLLQWQAICRAKELGCARYDMWGAPDVFDESDSMWGVYRFKRGFGGQVMQGLGAWDYPVNTVMYRTFATAMPKARSFLQKLRGG